MNPYEELERRSAALEKGFQEAATAAGVRATVNRVGSMMTAFFAEGPIVNWDTAKRSDTDRYARFFRAMLEEGVYLAPSQFECAFVGMSHTDEVIERTIEAARSAMKTVG
jgi:glutamate-1-semialdehyde 2,1-aminomutase